MPMPVACWAIAVWATLGRASYAARRLERGETWHQRYGWIYPEDISHWEAGDRPLGKRWISAEDDARRHATIDDGWQLRTDHFLVVTDRSLEAATDLATRLEKLYQIWQQMFGGFYLDQADLLRRFDGRETSGYRGKPFRVTYYRSRQEYNDALRQQQPRIDMTLGIYFDKTRSTHFFAGPDQDAGTIHHEAVHQFFQESRAAARNVGGLSNSWLIEGVACYFESLAEHEDPQIGPFIRWVPRERVAYLPHASGVWSTTTMCRWLNSRRWVQQTFSAVVTLVGCIASQPVWRLFWSTAGTGSIVRRW